MHANDRVIPFITELCRMDRFGGRCLLLRPDNWEIRDVPHWTEEHAAKLRARFPSIEVNVVSERSSLSGFIVRLHRQRASTEWAHLLATAILIATGAALVSALEKYKN